MDMDSEPRDDYQWWRISYSAEDGKTRQAEKRQPQGTTAATQGGDVVGYTIRKVSEIEVLQAAREEWGSVLLVYASENAMNARVDPAPPQLQVRCTNLVCSFRKDRLTENRALCRETMMPLATSLNIPQPSSLAIKIILGLRRAWSKRNTKNSSRCLRRVHRSTSSTMRFLALMRRSNPAKRCRKEEIRACWVMALLTILQHPETRATIPNGTMWTRRT